MRHALNPAALLAASLSCVACWRTYAQTAPSPLLTVRAELMKTVSSHALSEGDSFYLQTSAPWQRPGCTIPEKTTITGNVISLTKTGSGVRKTVLSVRFRDLTCAGSQTSKLTPVLVAMLGHTVFNDSALRRMATAGAEARTMASMFEPPRSNVPSSGDGMLTSKNTVDETDFSDFRKVTAPLVTGEVVGLRGLKLELPPGNPSTSLVSAHEIVLGGQSTTFVLALINAPAEETAVADASAKARSTPVTSLGKPNFVDGERKDEVSEEEQEVCASNGCREVIPTTESSQNNAAWAIPLASLGYQPRLEQRLNSLDSSASVHFLGDDQILFTFPLHTLIKRTKQQSFGDARPRKIRAVLLSRQDGHVLLIRDWIIPADTGSYVWRFGSGRVLAQVGDELVAFGPDLAPLQRFALPGPLLFLSPAPEGELVLLATLHEKHSAREHSDLAKFLGPDQPVDEDYDLTGLDVNLNAISSRLLHAEPSRPAMLRDAMIYPRQVRPGRWELDLIPWTGTKSVLTHVQSACGVQISTLAGNLVFVRGCIPNQYSSSWFRILDSKGANLLKGTTDHYELLQQADADASGELVATACSHFEKPIDFRSLVRAGDFSNLEINLYDAHTGKSQFDIHLAKGSSQQDTFALSPSGQDLTVLTTDQIQTYALHPPAVK